MSEFKLGLIGGGVMGEALLSGLLAKRIYAPEMVMVSDPSGDRREFLSQKYGVGVTSDNREVAAATEVVLLAVKPQIFDWVADDLEGLLKPGTIIISILAGVTLFKLERAFRESPVIRVMPNTPATVGAGVSALAAGSSVEPAQTKRATEILAAVGDVVQVPEYLMDAVTGLSGSGPGYVAIMIEALTDGGVAAGLPRAIASKLALDTVWGTAQLLRESQLHPAELKDRVTSPGGTTIAGIAELEAAGFRSALIKAVKAAGDRSRELGS